jgi:hypothetical protein
MKWRTTDVLDNNEIENRFGFHKAAIEGPESATEIHKNLRIAFKEFAAVLVQMLPADASAKRYRNLAYDDLERSSMWAHKAVAQMMPTIQE